MLWLNVTVQVQVELCSMCSIFVDDPFLNIVYSSDDPLPMQHPTEPASVYPSRYKLWKYVLQFEVVISTVCKSLW